MIPIDIIKNHLKANTENWDVRELNEKEYVFFNSKNDKSVIVKIKNMKNDWIIKDVIKKIKQFDSA